MSSQQPSNTVVISEALNGKEFTAESFLDYLRLSQKHWDNKERVARFPFWLFRGHRDKAWGLCPGLWREDIKKAEPVPSCQCEVYHRKLVLAYQAKRMSFLDKADTLGLTPSWLHRNFPLGDVDTFSEMTEADSLAQHYGITTHLLDWTSDPIVACYFATKPPFPHEGEQVDCCIWAFDASEWSPTIATEIKLIDGLLNIERPSYAANPFVQNQSGYFTYFSNTKEYFKYYGKWPRMDDYHPPSAAGVKLRKLVLKHKHVFELRELIRKEGMTLSKAMPTLQHVADEVNQAEKLMKQ